MKKVVKNAIAAERQSAKEYVPMVKIYTKTGDKGTTALFGGKRVSKSDAQVRAYGAVDEFSSILGVVMTTNIENEDKYPLE
jgi:cob(I)alamin adenosyltransferase